MNKNKLAWLLSQLGHVGSYMASYYGIRVNGSDGYTISEEAAIERLEDRLREVKVVVTEAEAFIKEYKRNRVKEAQEALFEIGG